MRSVPSERRNPVAADLFQRLRLMERRGSGFKKIIGAYQAELQKRNISRSPEFAFHCFPDTTEVSTQVTTEVVTQGANDTSTITQKRMVQNVTYW